MLAGGDGTCAETESGEYYCWGYGPFENITPEVLYDKKERDYDVPKNRPIVLEREFIEHDGVVVGFVFKLKTTNEVKLPFLDIKISRQNGHCFIDSNYKAFCYHHYKFSIKREKAYPSLSRWIHEPHNSEKTRENYKFYDRQVIRKGMEKDISEYDFTQSAIRCIIAEKGEKVRCIGPYSGGRTGGTPRPDDPCYKEGSICLFTDVIFYPNK